LCVHLRLHSLPTRRSSDLEVFRTPGEVAAELDPDEFKLYELIWQRTIASQMADAKGTTMSVRITGTAASGEECTFAASGRTISLDRKSTRLNSSHVKISYA